MLLCLRLDDYEAGHQEVGRIVQEVGEKAHQVCSKDREGFANSEGRKEDGEDPPKFRYNPHHNPRHCERR